MRYSSTAVDFPIATDVSQSIRASYTNFSSRTCVPVCARTRGHNKNDTLTIQTKRMKQTFNLVVQIDETHWRGKTIQIKDEETFRWLNYHLNKGLRVSIEKDSD